LTKFPTADDAGIKLIDPELLPRVPPPEPARSTVLTTIGPGSVMAVADPRYITPE
jgi:hypothetical protein